LAALAGAYLSIAYLSVVTKELSAGRGFIALANAFLQTGTQHWRSPAPSYSASLTRFPTGSKR